MTALSREVKFLDSLFFNFLIYGDSFHVVSIKTRVYSCRVVGGDCDHRHSRWAVVAGGTSCTGGCTADVVFEQHPSIGIGGVEL